MDRKEIAQKAGMEIFKDSEYPVPNTYCFIKGVEWADSNPTLKWIDSTDRLPQQGQIILFDLPNPEFKVVSYEVMKFDNLMISTTIKTFYWLPVPELILG